MFFWHDKGWSKDQGIVGKGKEGRNNKIQYGLAVAVAMRFVALLTMVTLAVV